MIRPAVAHWPGTAAGALLLAGALLITSSTAHAGAIDSGACRSRTVKSKIARIHHSARAIVVKALQPDASPASWAADFTDLVSDSTLLIGLCEDPAILVRACPLCDVPEHVEVTVESAPALIIQWLVGRHVFDGTQTRQGATTASL